MSYRSDRNAYRTFDPATGNVLTRKYGPKEDGEAGFVLHMGDVVLPVRARQVLPRDNPSATSENHYVWRLHSVTDLTHGGERLTYSPRSQTEYEVAVQEAAEALAAYKSFYGAADHEVWTVEVAVAPYSSLESRI